MWKGESIGKHVETPAKTNRNNPMDEVHGRGNGKNRQGSRPLRSDPCREKAAGRRPAPPKAPDPFSFGTSHVRHDTTWAVTKIYTIQDISISRFSESKPAENVRLTSWATGIIELCWGLHSIVTAQVVSCLDAVSSLMGSGAPLLFLLGRNGHDGAGESQNEPL